MMCKSASEMRFVKELINRQTQALVSHMVPVRWCCSKGILVSSCNILTICVVLQVWQRQCYRSTCLRSGACWCPSAGPPSRVTAPPWPTYTCTSCPSASTSSQPPDQLHHPQDHPSMLCHQDTLQGCKPLPSARRDWMQPWHIPHRPPGCCPAWHQTLCTRPAGFLLFHHNR